MIPLGLKIDQEYHVVELNWRDRESLAWCLERFGDPRADKWFERSNKIYFYDPKDHMMFLLRWA
jgi:hypothetical protein